MSVGLSLLALMMQGPPVVITPVAPPGPITIQVGSPSPFDATRDPTADVDAALDAARQSGKHVLIVFGGSWCHDSDALITAMERPATATMLARRYEIVFVDIPFSRAERSIAVAHRLGLGDIEGTPTVLILRPDGTPTNLEDAPRWRNAASRKPAAIHRALERAAPAVGG